MSLELWGRMNDLGDERRPRARSEWVEGGEQLRIPIRASRWTPLGAAGMMMLALLDGARWRDDGWFTGFGLIWLALWVLTLLTTAGVLLSQMFCTETVRVRGGDLVVWMGAGPIGRTWRYAGVSIAQLQGCDGSKGHGRPFFQRPTMGGVRFEYHGKTRYLAPGADQTEGAAIAEWLGRRLPKRATSFE